MNNKVKILLSWSRNPYNYHHLSAWVMNDEGKGCYELEIGIGINKLSAFLNLAWKMKCRGTLHYLRNIAKQETVFSVPGPVKHFKIKQVSSYSSCCEILQRHSLFLFRWWKTSHDIVCPNGLVACRSDAIDLISNTAKEKGFDYRIHD